LAKFLTLVLGLIGSQRLVDAGQLRLSWSDNSMNEDGFSIERSVGTTGAYLELASVGANATAYIDTTVVANTTYCYRVRAVNADGFSLYSNEGCATTAAATTSYTLTVSKSGNGSGTVTGINCGTDCSESYADGATVELTAVAASGSSFAGWTGTGCTLGTVSVTGNITCTATFNLTTYSLTMNVAGEMTSAGSAGGRVTSNPAGIDCGADCSEDYPSGQIVSLTPIPNANSVFAGWTGDTDCAGGSVNMNANKSCTANFALSQAVLTVATIGSGTVTSMSGEIDCGSTCSSIFITGNTVVLHATPAGRFIFAGWSGGNCVGTQDCSVTLTPTTTVTATFVNDPVDRVGVYRPSTGEWFLDQNGNGVWDGCEIDVCVQTFSAVGALPVVGDWDGSGFTKLGLFLPSAAQWWLDMNSDHIWDGCEVDKCQESFGGSEDIPLAGQWKSLSSDRIGTFRPNTGTWYLDASGNGTLNCRRDYCFRLSNYANGDRPVAGDWTGGGLTRVGLYRPSTGQWFLDRSGSRSWGGCSWDTCISSFGTAEDLPVTGDWSGTETTKIGVFRAATGEWMLDLNGNGQWDGCEVDLCLSGFGVPGDIPIVGRW
jgi:hypothetical protein